MRGIIGTMAQTPDVPTLEAPEGFSFNLDLRKAAALGLGLLGLGIIIGFRVRGGVPDVLEVPTERGAPYVVRTGPCPECAEKAIQAERAAATTAPQPEPTPGDSSIPGLG
jgi:hypothetical protein